MEHIQSTVIDPMRAAAMHATLGHKGDAPGEGDQLPPFWHWSQFWQIADAGNLGRDGHPEMGQFLPETGLPRRMWAGGQVEFLRPIPIGASAQRRSIVGPPTAKKGRSGPLVFASVTHEISVEDELAVREIQDLVFREDPDPNTPTPAPKLAPEGADTAREFQCREVDLFRYSALTFNGHRIHYDRDYCRDVEGYPDLIVHGPLLAQRLVDLAVEMLGSIKHFTFRAQTPIFQSQSFSACAKSGPDGLQLWIANETGHLAMTGTAS